MAIYHFSVKVISRANGSSAVAAAAYRSASCLSDSRLGRNHDFSNKAGVVHSEVLLPDGAPREFADRETLWNAVEAAEKRKDAQLAREVEFAIPRELDRAEGVRLARDFVQAEFVSRGMIADLNVHWDRLEDGTPKPHAHVMLTMREVGASGLGAKNREWNATSELQGWRERWAEHANHRLAELGIDATIDHRSFKDQGVELEPQHKIGAAGVRREDRGEQAERAAEHRDIARRNGERIIADPSVALDAITRQQSTFTDHDLMRFVHRHSDEPQQYAKALSAVRTSPELVALGKDGQGRERFTTREMMAVERQLEASAERLAERRGHGISAADRTKALSAADTAGLRLGQEQADAVGHITGRGDLALVVGYAGTGKSAMLGVAREAWERRGLTVRGAALSGIAAESLEAGSGIGSRTIASLEHAWAQGRETLTSSDVLVIDEAGMIGSRQMQRVLATAESAGAKVVLVGDPEQLQAIEAGAAFRALVERHGAAEITHIRRQREDWQRQATRDLATGRTGAALEAYERAGAVREHATREEARAAVVDGWDAVRFAQPEASQVILSHTRADAAELNRLARERVRASGGLGEDVAVATERGERALAVGDRVMFLRNERSLGVKNGSLGRLKAVSATATTVRTDDGRHVAFDFKDYAHIDHGYAATIHKAQGVTVDRTHILATPGLDRHAAYVALSRHRESVTLHYGADDFAERPELVKVLGRDRPKDTTLDYRDAFAARRGINEPIAVLRKVQEPGRKAGRFAGLQLDDGLGASRRMEGPTPGELLDARVRDYARSYADVERMERAGLPVLEHQAQALKAARLAFDRRDPGLAQDMKAAFRHAPGLAGKIDRPGGLEAIREAARVEYLIRTDPERRAARFVETWRGLQARRAQLQSTDQAATREAVELRMGKLAAGLSRDPQVESILHGRRRELGLGADIGRPGRALGAELVRTLELGRGLGLER